MSNNRLIDARQTVATDMDRRKGIRTQADTDADVRGLARYAGRSEEFSSTILDAINAALIVGVNAQGGADVTTTTSTTVYSDAIVVTLNLGPGSWTINAFGSVLMRHSAAAAVDVRTDINGTAQTEITQSVVSAGYDRLAVAGTLANVPGMQAITVKITFKSNAAGTTTADQPALTAIAQRVR